MKNFALNQFRRIIIIGHIAQLRRHQWFGEDKLKEIQECRLRKIIRHAYSNVEFYNKLFKSMKIKPSDIKSVKDLKRLPIISKKEVQENYPNKIIAKGTNLNKCHFKTTTGSTGIPLKICFSEKNYAYRLASNRYSFFESGVKWTDKFVIIRDNSYSSEKRWFNKFGILRNKNIPIFDSLENIIKNLILESPDVIFTYPSMLSLLAKEIKEKNISSIIPKLILIGGETVTNSQREKFCEIFKSDVFRIYGSEEFGRLAFECNEHSGYHIITDNVVVEFVKEGEDVSPGERGEVVVTGLTNYRMPLIRYKLGDIAIPSESKCPCGRGLPLIKHVEGREDDFLVLPSGRKISPRMINVIESIPGIKEYKTIQESKERFVVKLIKDNKFNERTISEVKKQIKIGCLGEEIKVEVRLVNEIPRERTGKLRAVISNVKE